MVHVAMKYIWTQKWKQLPVAKIKGKKCILDRSAFMIDYISAHKPQLAFMGLDFEANKPRMKAELRVMMAKL